MVTRLRYLGGRMIASETRLIRFAPVAQPVGYVPGQFMQLEIVHRGERFRRSYSIANAPEESGELEFAVSRIASGRGVDFLGAIEVGTEVEARGPFGSLVLLPEAPVRHVMVGTATGTAPFRAMLPQFASRLMDGWPAVSFWIGARSREEVLFHDEFVTFAEAHSGFDLRVAYSREMPTVPMRWESPGRVQSLVEALAEREARSVFYLCGNPAMVDEVAVLLATKSVPADAIRRERYTSGA